MLSNIYWKELSTLVYVWVAFLAVQIVKVKVNHSEVSYKQNIFLGNHLLAQPG